MDSNKLELEEEIDEPEFEEEIFDFDIFKLRITTISFLPISKLLANQIQGVEISGQKLWTGSIVVLQYIINSSTDFALNSSTILELGAGTGVLGMGCKKLGAFQVILTDHDQRSIEHIKKDAIVNDVQVSVETLDWLTFDMGFLAIHFSFLIEKEQHLKVVAGDVLYKLSLVNPFLVCAKLILSTSKDSTMYLCHIPRAGVEHEKVQNSILLNGLCFDCIPADLWKHGSCISYGDIDDLKRALLYKIFIQT